MSGPHRALAELATQYWKLCAAFEHKSAQDEGAGQSDEAMLRYARGRLDAILQSEGMELRVFNGQPFTASCPAIPLNSEEVGGDARIERTLEPTILHAGEVVLSGKIMLAAIVPSEA
ncbi:MAG: hypothetical protein WBA51_11180 [Erythrobacter sp.]